MKTKYKRKYKIIMSVIRNRYLKRSGLKSKTDMQRCRRSVKDIPKCNVRFYINNYAFKVGVNDNFVMQSSK